ncbi:M20/M25/M40 family metallo-hydrolase [Proteiniclasticum sp. SCR006]|uniref:M20/M25/M40 family metallo-hydrolase n=1 Tax=Proteiniclasticum aestuarii TaxID=2817862 RepID=A0A939KI34_9CLOT|nr:M20/M25/M40 family metallo-hydrolase [Proteiniclasticum aestuarii]MBO1263551.1 M20/M25/M40 family metallo-hydrolase [Proteiniclasticum aestuarii]
MTDIKMMERLSNAFGPGGFEEDVVRVIKEYTEDFRISMDAMNNVYISLKGNTGNRPVIMLDAHLDEVGFMVQTIDAKGLLSIVPLGGWITTNISAHSMIIKNRKGEYVKGIVVSKPPHFMTAEEKDSGKIHMENLRIDVGCTSREEVVELFGIETGDPVVPDVTFHHNDRNHVISGKAFDNRIGCLAVIETLKKLKDMNLPYDVVGALAAQEEVGTRGAQVTTQVVKPDLAIVFEGSPADDMYYDEYTAQGALKKGVQIRHMDQSYVSHAGFIHLAQKTAKEKKIPYQSAVRRGGGTNAGKIHLGHEAVPVLVLGIPSRYVHTHYSYAALEDVDSAVSLAVETLRAMDQEAMDTLLKKNFL